MKTHFFYRLMLFFVTSLTFFSCSIDEVNSPDSFVKVGFVNQTHTMMQDMETLSIPLKLDVKAIETGYITIELSGNASYGSDFITEPQAVNNKLRIKLLANTKDTSFVVSRVNNTTTEKIINLKLSNPTAGFALGAKVTAEIKLNAQPIVVNKFNFDASTGSISEGNAEGLVVGLNSTNLAANNSNIKVKITTPQGISYGTHFHTVPAAVLNEITLQLGQNTQNTSFKIIPVNDNLVLGDYIISFELIEATGGLEIGENKVFTASVLENDQNQQVVNTISELKSKFNEHQGDWYLSTDYYIEGVITSNGNTANNSVYIQDASGGILIRFNTPNIFNLGDKIRLNLLNGTGAIINNQKSINGVSSNGYVKYAENIVVQPETITIPQLLSGNYEGKRVKIENVYFVNADNIVTFLGNHHIKNNNDVATVATYENAEFSNNVLPTGLISISGIVGDWGRLLPQKFTHDVISN
ncbi:DUF5689 domain-containing protein [Sabulilitoribacter multivorans]|uniref:DUF5689 domain-containing protein n=1 Tax=Flaviramulus multivorans TaxID=1304750 RepID=A0ABS9IDX9_9FLAO|nr:DUF5689 domain-containing protein [Flaviramulus multivorans]MCF7559009.1 DUF5689 domain-containing protein [Flaviramulus multivorans]